MNQIGWGTPPGADPLGSYYEAGVTQSRRRECLVGCDGADSGALIEADIIIDNHPPPEFASSRCLLGTLLHEVGHFLGLEHLAPPAVMQTETSGCPIALTDADRDALAQRYGKVAQLVANDSGALRNVSGSATDEEQVRELITRQFNLFRREDWGEVYKTYTPRFQLLCPYNKFVRISARSTGSPVDPVKVGFTDLHIDVRGERAYATYRYTYAATPTTAITDADPDVYAKIDNVWLDDIDPHTDCTD